MVHLEVTMFKIPVEQRAEVVKNLTETVGNILDLSRELCQRVSVLFNLKDANEIGRGGELLENRGEGIWHIDVYGPVFHYDKKHELGLHLTNALGDTLKLTPEQREHVFVTFHQFSPENVASGGRMLAELVQV